jgi:3-oxoadipate enol-lactonase
MPFARLNGTTIHYAARPAQEGAPTIVFSNALGTDFRIWGETAEALPGSFGIVFYDKRGHGLSDQGGGDRLDAHVGDLAALVGHLGLSRVVLCGLSVGGVIGQAVALRHAHMLDALVLCCTAAKVGTEEAWNDRIATARGPGLAALADPVMERWFSAAFRKAEPALLAGMTNMLTRQPVEGYAAVCALLRDTDLTAEVPRIAVPTLGVACTEDGSTPPDLVRDMVERIPGAAFALIEGAGHIPCVERPQELAGILLAFLEEKGLAA